MVSRYGCGFTCLILFGLTLVLNADMGLFGVFLYCLGFGLRFADWFWGLQLLFVVGDLVLGEMVVVLFTV